MARTEIGRRICPCKFVKKTRQTYMIPIHQTQDIDTVGASQQHHLIQLKGYCHILSISIVLEYIQWRMNTLRKRYS